MSDNVESMFYTGDKPWHGLGIGVQGSLNSEEALIMGGLNYEVVSTDIFVNGLIVKGYKANVRSTDNQTLGIVTDRYKIVQNKDAFAFTDNLIGDNCQYETAGSLSNGKKIWLLAKLPETRILSDKVEPYLVFSNTHDGTGAIKVAITPIRVVCQNTLNLALNNASRSWSTKHVGNMDLKMQEAQRTLELASQYMDALKFEAVKLSNETISNPEFSEFVNELFPLPLESEKVTDRKIDNIKILQGNLSSLYYTKKDIGQYVGTKYGVIQAVTDFVTHAKPLRNTAGYQENLFNKVIDGHKIIDQAYELLKKSA